MDKQKSVFVINTNKYEIYCPKIHIDTGFCVINTRHLVKIKTKDKTSYVISTDYVPIGIYEKKIVHNTYNRITFYDSLNTARKYGLYEAYNGEDLVDDIQKSIFKNKNIGWYTEYHNSSNNTKSPSYISTGHLKYTFGVEIETCSGRLHPALYTDHNLNLSCVRDGSLVNDDGDLLGGEYVTGILSGDLGMNNLKQSLNIINKRCEIDHKCAVHVHIGGFINNKAFTVLSNLLAMHLQEEVFETLPLSRKNNSYANKINYVLLPYIKKYGYYYGIDLAYEYLYNIMLNQHILPSRQLGNKYNKSYNHPGGRYTDRYQHDIALHRLPRYNWINLIPANFNIRNNNSYTIEFRPHGASLNFNKIKNWILFCMAFVHYVENNQLDIINKSKIHIKTILNNVYDKKLSNYLISYFEERKEKFKKANNERLEYLDNNDDVYKTNNLKSVISCV